MRRYLITFLIFAGLSVVANAQQLMFDGNGEFKIVQFTDLHYIHGAAKSPAALDCIRKVLDAEKPDLIVFTGDMIYGKAKESLKDILDVVDSYGIPFCTAFGNHDDEAGLSRSAVYDIIQSDSNSINPERGSAVSPDYAVEIVSPVTNKVAAVLYCLDSHSYSPLDRKVTGTYDWIKFDQIDWYRKQSAGYTVANGGVPVPSLAFFHIPLPEYAYAAANQCVKSIGIRMEPACAPGINSGMFASMLECGDVMGVFTGHDHDNDYAMDYMGVCLAYGRFSGCSNEYNHIQNGARVIILKEGQRSFDSYIRERSGAKVFPFTFPDCFSRKEYAAE